MKIEGLEERIKALATPVLEGLGMELVDAEYTVEHGRRILRFYIDKPGGVTIDDCGRVSSELGTLLDVNDVMHERYSLEVSSPGLDRPLVKEKDFTRFAGRKARIRTRTDIGGRRNFRATIIGVGDGKVVIEDSDGRRFEIAVTNIEKARLVAEI